MGLGEQLKAEYLRMVNPKAVFEGCSASEIEFLKQCQEVECLPETYIDISGVMGRSGIDKIIIQDSNYEYLKIAKVHFDGTMEMYNLVYPPDVFVFMGHDGYIYYFFRTRDCQNDPPVYGYHDSYDGFIKLSNSISDFFIQQLEWLKLKNPRIPEWIPLDTDLYYDQTADDFVPIKK